MEKWYFTFMDYQEERNNFIVFEGTFKNARDLMFQRYGKAWDYQYSEKEWFNEEGVSQAEEFNLTEIK